MQTCVAGDLKARAASREEIGARTTSLTLRSLRACFSLFTAVSPLKQNISLFEGRARKAYLRARTKLNRQLDTQASITSHKKSVLHGQEIRDLPLLGRHFAWTGIW